MVHGYAVYTTTTGKVYKGHFERGLMHGKGKMIDKNGKITEGQWDKGKLTKNT